MAPILALRLLGQGCEFIGLALFARRLGPVEFGTLSVAYVGCRYAGLVADWGASIAGTRDVARAASDDTITRLASWRTQVTVVLTIVAALVLRSVNPALVPLALSVAGRGMARDWLALGRGNPARAALPSAVAGTVMLVGAVTTTTPGLGGAATVIGVAWAAAAVVSLTSTPLPRALRWVTLAPAGWYLVLLVADQLAATADLLILGAHDRRAAGLYAAAYRFPSAWITVQGLVVTGLLPGVAHAVHRGDVGSDELWRRALRVGTAAAGVVAIATPPALALLPLVFGSTYADARPALAVLMAATAVTAFGTAFQPLYFAGHGDRTLALTGAAIAGVNIAANLAAIPRFGILGAAFTTLVTNTAMAVFLVTSTRRPPTALTQGSPGSTSRCR